jgi:hypothetical protein
VPLYTNSPKPQPQPPVSDNPWGIGAKKSLAGINPRPQPQPPAFDSPWTRPQMPPQGDRNMFKRQPSIVPPQTDGAASFSDLLGGKNTVPPVPSMGGGKDGYGLP